MVGTAMASGAPPIPIAISLLYMIGGNAEFSYILTILPNLIPDCLAKFSALTLALAIAMALASCLYLSISSTVNWRLPMVFAPLADALLRTSPILLKSLIFTEILCSIVYPFGTLPLSCVQLYCG